MPDIGKMKQIKQRNVRIVNVSSGEIHPMQEKQNIVIHQDAVPSGGFAGDLLAKNSNADYDAHWITPANAVEQDNTRPITSAAVYLEIGNINALLATI